MALVWENEVWSSKYLKQYYIWGKGKSTGDHKQDVVFSFYSGFKLGFLTWDEGRRSPFAGGKLRQK